MKSIELTEEHKSKLLEMCKILFPEYYWSFDKCESKYYDIKIDNILTGTLQGKSEMDQTSEIVIHWFEFCLYYLVDKIISDDMNESYMSNKDFYMGGLVYKDNSYNPIDILYKQFKKLKV